MHVKIMSNFCFTWWDLTRACLLRSLRWWSNLSPPSAAVDMSWLLLSALKKLHRWIKRWWFCSIDILPLRFLIKMKRMPVENGARAYAFIRYFFSLFPSFLLWSICTLFCLFLSAGFFFFFFGLLRKQKYNESQDRFLSLPLSLSKFDALYV